MSIEFNKFNRYDLLIGKNIPKQKEAKEAEEVKETKETLNYDTFKGLENEADLLTQNTQYLYGLKLGRYSNEDKAIADETNEILASLGYKYRVSAAQVASVANGFNTVVKPGMKLAQDAAVAARIQDPFGPFADLFA